MKFLSENKRLIILAILIRFIVMPFLFHPDIKTYYFQASHLKQGVVDIYSYLDRNKANLTIKEGFVYFPLTYLFLGTYDALATPFLGGGYSAWLESSVVGASQLVGIFRYLFILKLPYLILDILIAFVLMTFFDKDEDKKKVFKLWLFNPFTIILIYVFSNVDVMPVLLTLLSLYFLKNKKEVIASVILALAVGFKAYPLLLFPIFLFNVRSIREFIKISCAFLIPLIAVIAPFWSTSFITSALASGLTGRIVQATIDLGYNEKLPIFFVVYSIFLVVGYLKRKRVEGWECCLSILLLLVSVIHFHIQWLLWFSPFLAIFYIRNSKMRLIVVAMMLFAFLVPFLYNDKFMALDLFLPINRSFDLLHTPFTMVKRIYDPNILGSVFHSMFAGISLALSWTMFWKIKYED